MEIPVQAKLQRLLRIAGGVHVVARVLQDAAHDVAYPVFIFDDEDPLAPAPSRDGAANRDVTYRPGRARRKSDAHGGSLVGL